MAVLKKLREIGDNIEGFPKLISHKETENSAEFIINVSHKFIILFPLAHTSTMIGTRTKYTQVDAAVPDAKVQHTNQLQNCLQACKLPQLNLYSNL